APRLSYNIQLVLTYSRINFARHSSPTRRSSDLEEDRRLACREHVDEIVEALKRVGQFRLRAGAREPQLAEVAHHDIGAAVEQTRSEEHTSELQSRENLVCRLLLEKKKPS